MATTTVSNRTFNEIEVGESASETRVITKDDIHLFAHLSGDKNPTHLDETFARERLAGAPQAHSMLGGSLFSAVLGNKLPGWGTMYKRQELVFEALVREGDQLTITVTAAEKWPDTHAITFACEAVNQRGVRVISGEAEVIAPAERITHEIAEGAEVTLFRHDGFDPLIRHCAEVEPVLTAVAHPCDEVSLSGVIEAVEAQIIKPILVGPEARIQGVAAGLGADISGFEIINTSHSHESAARAVEIVREGKAEALMKGSLHTDELMHEVASRATGLRTARRISHAFVMSVATYGQPLIVTDAAINIYPDLADKADICQNAIELAHAIGIDTPKVAILSAVETVTPKISSTLEAAALCKMADRGQIKGGILDGPLAFDNAISKEAALTKGIESEVAGEANILLVPDLEAGNMLAKQLSFLAKADAAGIVLGARVPIILTSRADSVRTRIASCAVAATIAEHRRREAKLAAE
ncbi:MAG: bifunctional enoyl-CoA hydratase/phosphate acetyltransferase [Magnetovibrionaceae bacterium]